MASSNIKLFDENKGNMLSDSEFSISNQRMNGLQTGVASSQLQNKAMYQASLVAYAIAQVMMQNGKNANDTDAVSAFVANLSGTMLQKVYDIATTAEAQAGVATGKWMSPALVKSAIDSLAAKAQNILSDETKTLFGLGSNAVPDDVFSFLGKYNQYWWKRTPAVWHDAYATFGDVTSVETGGYSSGSSTYSISYSSSYSVDSFGNVTLVSPSTLSVSYNDYTAMNALKGRYFKSNLSDVPGIYFVSADAPDATRATIDSVRYVYIDGAKLIGHAQGYTYGSVELVNSSDRNAYPDSGVHDGYEYEYCGIPFENFFNQVKIAIGSYVGTGTYGADNPNEITIGFEPKLIILNKGFYGVRSSSDANSSTNGVSVFFGDGTYVVWQSQSSGSPTFNSTILDLFITHTGATWYYNGSYNYDGKNQNCPALQLNDSGITYTYVAFG